MDDRFDKYKDEIPDFEGQKCFDCGALQWGASLEDTCNECGTAFKEETEE